MASVVKPFMFRVMSLPYIVKEYHLINYFSQFGQVVNCYMPRDGLHSRSKGLAFIEIIEESGYNQILEKRAHTDLGINVFVLPAPPLEDQILMTPAAIARAAPNSKFTFTKLARGRGAKAIRTPNPREVDFHGFEGWFNDRPMLPSIRGAHYAHREEESRKMKEEEERKMREAEERSMREGEEVMAQGKEAEAK